ncbi:uncharacterized protein LOC113507613 isoform X2 [Trichoplusia ni]|uniref:Uncharacterized protein LOC113507613 isoform X2 n=1 Tax=Trichoplusia ni TaxID=7111 RepID=A0A7E5WZH9_TRINI|nr:uncharacterized protein LOC113507613 isoform X2 [Trichoplusia ni]
MSSLKKPEDNRDKNNDGAQNGNAPNDSSEKEKEETTGRNTKRHSHSVVINMEVDAGSRAPEGASPMYYEPARNIFVRFVFAILLFMLILTAGFVMFVYMTDLRDVFIRYGLVPMLIGLGGMLGLNYAMMCSACTRVPPCNFFCLFLAVCFMSLLTACITAQYRTQIVLLALMATTVTVLVCLCLACTNFDFTKYLLYVIVIGAAVAAIAMIVSITMLITNTRYKPVTLVILLAGTIVNVVVLVMELQMILGGRTVELTEDDYALGAFMLYTSIIDIFLKLVHILGILDSF